MQRATVRAASARAGVESRPLWSGVPDDVTDYVFGGLSTNNRNIAIYETLIIDTSVDDHVFPDPD